MTERTGSTRYEIEIGGHASDRVLRPVIDDFTVEPTVEGTTRLVGAIRDSSHLNGLLVHFTSLNIDVIALRRLDDAADGAPSPHTHEGSAMTVHTPVTLPTVDTDDSRRGGTLSRVGGAAALVAAGTFAYGIALFATTLADYTDPDATPAESVDFLVDHQGTLLAWYLGIFIVFGAALVPFGLALRKRLVGDAPILANTAAVFAMIWAGLMYATGMISNIGIESVADLADTDPERAITVWSSIDVVTNGLGGGNELVGGIWILLVSIAGLVTTALPRWLNVVGVVTAVAGVFTVIPAFEAIEMVFGLGSIIWFVGAGIALLRHPQPAGMTS